MFHGRYIQLAIKKESKGLVKKRWKYFYLDGKLHQLYAFNRGKDEAIAWSYPDRKKVIYSWSSVKKYGYPGFKAREVANILNRHKVSLSRYMMKGQVPIPQCTYRIPDGQESGIYIWSKDDILKTLEYISTIHKGWPRNDGFINAPDIPTREEVRAETEYELKLFTLTRDGKLVRVWDAEMEEY